MNKRQAFAIILAGIIIMLAASCAQVVPPAGGPVDRKAPRAVKYIPDSAALNFTGNNILIEFDEFITLKDLPSQLLISPPLKRTPDIRVKNKSLLISFDDTLSENTTYAFSFGSSIRDITEGNAAENFQYIFSTGAHIDSLSLSGKVIRAFNQQAEKGIIVMLYTTRSDSAPYKSLPSYFAKTEADGTFRIRNIRPGTYKAFALKDANSNFIYDLPDESIGFTDKPVTIGSSKDTLSMQVFESSGGKMRIKKTVSQFGQVMIVFQAPVEDLEITPLGVELKNTLIEYSAGRDTVLYWFGETAAESLPLKITHNKTIIDTVQMSVLTRQQLQSRRGKLALSVKTNVSKGARFDLGEEIDLDLSNPVIAHAASKIVLTKGRDTLKFKSSFTDSVHRKFSIAYPFAADSTYRLSLLGGAFTDIFGLASDTMSVTFKMQEEKFYGSARIKAKQPAGNYIFQLLNEKGIVVNEALAKGDAVLSYPRLKPGSYRLKVIHDANGNSKWDTGSYIDKKQPEKISFYPETITIRSGWELEKEW